MYKQATGGRRTGRSRSSSLQIEHLCRSALITKAVSGEQLQKRAVSIVYRSEKQAESPRTIIPTRSVVEDDPLHYGPQIAWNLLRPV